MAVGRSEVEDRLAHLEQNRGLILERAALAGAAALFPIPLLDDLLAGAARAELLRRLAASRNVGADESAIFVLASLNDDGARAIATRYALRRSFRRLATAVRAAGHAGDFAAIFAIATLFDHYCARHHVGPGLDVERAHELRLAIDRAVTSARGGFARRGVKNAASRTGRFLLAAPRAFAGRLPLLGPMTAERVEPGELVLPRGGSIVQRSMRAIGGLLGETGRGWVNELVEAFEREWDGRRWSGVR